MIQIIIQRNIKMIIPLLQFVKFVKINIINKVINVFMQVIIFIIAKPTFI